MTEQEKAAKIAAAIKAHDETVIARKKAMMASMTAAMAAKKTAKQ